MDLRVAAYGVILDDEDRMLLAHWSEGRHRAWTLPGGGLEAGEDPQDAVRREIEEETGYVAEVGELLGIHSRVIPAARRIADSDVPLHTLRIVYRARVIGGDLRDEVGGSTDEAGWFSLDQMRSLRRGKLIDIARTWAGLPPVPRR
ncbi:NUDIX hydrolase [Microbacterium sp. GXF7504]